MALRPTWPSARCRAGRPRHTPASYGPAPAPCGPARVGPYPLPCGLLRRTPVWACAPLPWARARGPPPCGPSSAAVWARARCHVGCHAAPPCGQSSRWGGTGGHTGRRPRRRLRSLRLDPHRVVRRAPGAGSGAEAWARQGAPSVVPTRSAPAERMPTTRGRGGGHRPSGTIAHNGRGEGPQCVGCRRGGGSRPAEGSAWQGGAHNVGGGAGAGRSGGRHGGLGAGREGVRGRGGLGGRGVRRCRRRRHRPRRSRTPRGCPPRRWTSRSGGRARSPAR